jgi:hypothetical protein
MTPDELKQDKEEHEEHHQGKCRLLHLLGLLKPGMTQGDIFFVGVGSALVWERFKESYGPGGEGQKSTLEIVEEMTPAERATLRAEVLQNNSRIFARFGM